MLESVREASVVPQSLNDEVTTDKHIQRPVSSN